jgi:NADH-quinone oxidoreductase subunit G
MDHRDGELHRFVPRRNVEVNKSWICDIGRMSYKDVAVQTRVARARLKGTAGAWEPAGVDEALDGVAERLREAGSAAALLASPQGTNEDLFAFRSLADALGARLDFRVGDPQEKLHLREDDVLLRADRNPNTQGCLDQGLGRTGVSSILADCRSGAVRTLLLQGPELLRLPEARDALAAVPFVAVMATHDGPELELAHAVLPASEWAEVEGTFTNYQRRVQRIRPAVPPPGDARPRWELAAGLLRRLGSPLAATSARELFLEVARGVPGYAGLDYRALGATGRALAAEGPAPPVVAAGA